MADKTDFTQRETPTVDTYAEKTGHRRMVPVLAMAFSTLLLGACGLNQVQPGQPSTSAQNQPSTSATPVLVGTKQYSSAPPMRIDQSKQYFATVKMAKGGQFVIQLYPDKAPITVNSFVFLAQQGFFDGTSFHRVLEGFMAQGGDPSGTGMGGPGYQFANEANDLTFDKAGVVAMANAGPNTNGSQFFITFGPTGLSESEYTIFGQVISGMDVVNALTRRDPQQNPTFTGDIIQSISITEK
ncbi:MAG: peptidylprolyl isomerase [Anaerolineales bacterium]|jgi:cyclophilin family peptidyl-prolyl cis-trans isomerase